MPRTVSWLLKEKVGSHIIRRNNIHHCEQGGIIGRMGGVFSVIEDNHIHHINNMMEQGGAEIAGIKMHAAIDVLYQRNHIHHCTWVSGVTGSTGNRITQNLLHDKPASVLCKKSEGRYDVSGSVCGSGHGPTLIDNNIFCLMLPFVSQHRV